MRLDDGNKGKKKINCEQSFRNFRIIHRIDDPIGRAEMFLQGVAKRTQLTQSLGRIQR